MCGGDGGITIAEYGPFVAPQRQCAALDGQSETKIRDQERTLQGGQQKNEASEEVCDCTETRIQQIMGLKCLFKCPWKKLKLARGGIISSPRV